MRPKLSQGMLRLQQHPEQPGLRPPRPPLSAHHPAARDRLQPGLDAQRLPGSGEQRPHPIHETWGGPFAGVRHPQTLWPLLCHGHRPHDGGPAERLLPRLPQLHQLPV
ncbi:hypothetical protein E2320_007238, partial [Naja naja]